jgi:guanyl-specific ribonuclease Sa
MASACQPEFAASDSGEDAFAVWDFGRSPTTVPFACQMGRLFLSAVLLLTILAQYGVRGAGAREVDDTGTPIGHGVLDRASCEIALAGAVSEEEPEGDSTSDGFMAAARRKKDAVAEAWAEVAPDKPVILVTTGNAVGGTLDGWVDTAKEKGSSASDYLISAGMTAWTTLSESELAALLGSTVHWAAYEELMTEHPELQGTAGPVIEFATGLSPNGEIATRDILINTALLAVPAGKLGPVLGKGGKYAVKYGPDVLILVDNVVVARIAGGAKRAVGLAEGHIDEFGRLVVRTAPALEKIPLTSLPAHAQRAIQNQLKAQRAKGVRGSGTYYANAALLLPVAYVGYYRMFPVEDPDAPGEVLQWMVIGDQGELYFTEDCGNSFVEISLADASPVESILSGELGLWVAPHDEKGTATTERLV